MAAPDSWLTRSSLAIIGETSTPRSLSITRQQTYHFGISQWTNLLSMISQTVLTTSSQLHQRLHYLISDSPKALLRLSPRWPFILNSTTRSMFLLLWHQLCHQLAFQMASSMHLSKHLLRSSSSFLADVLSSVRPQCGNRFSILQYL